MASPKDHVKALERRLTFLTGLTRAAEPNTQKHAYARHERNALLWAMGILREHVGMPTYTAAELEAAADLATDEAAKAERTERRRAERRRAEWESYGAVVPPADDTRSRQYGRADA